MKADRNEDNEISEQEIDRLMIRIKAFFGRLGRKLDEEAIRTAFRHSLTKTNISLFNITKSFIEEEEEEGPVACGVCAPPAFATDENRDIETGAVGGSAPASAPAPAPAAGTQQQQEKQQGKPVEPQVYTLQRIPAAPSNVQPPARNESETIVIKMTQESNEKEENDAAAADSSGTKTTNTTETSEATADSAPHVRPTGLLLRNTESMKMEGHAPEIRGGSINSGTKTNDDMLLDGLLSSNSRDFDAASSAATKGKVVGQGRQQQRVTKKPSQEVDGLLGYILQSFSGPELIREERKKQLMMSDV